MKHIFYSCGGETSFSEIPLGIGYLMSFVLFDTPPVFAHDQDELFKLLDDGRTISCLYLSSPAWGLKEAVGIAGEAISQSRSKTCVFLGGQGALWDGLKDYACFDCVIRGEGELILLMLREASVRVPMSQPLVIRGEPLSNLDLLHFPKRGKCDSGTVPFVTSRGCPYHCAFCSSRAHWGPQPRFHSAEYFIYDVEHCSKLYPHMKTVYIVDDLWTADKRRFHQIHELWMKKGFHKRFGLQGFTRTNLLSDDTIRCLKEMNMPFLRVGVESGSDAILEKVGKGVTVHDHQQAIDCAHKHGMLVCGSFVKGLPFETEEDRRLTAEFIKRNEGKLEVMGDYTFRPFPGCALYEGENPLEVDMRVRP